MQRGQRPLKSPAPLPGVSTTLITNSLIKNGEKMKVGEKGQINIHISGTVFVAIALAAVICLVAGVTINQFFPGQGRGLIWIGIILIFALIIFGFLYWASEQESSYRYR